METTRVIKKPTFQIIATALAIALSGCISVHEREPVAVSTTTTTTRHTTVTAVPATTTVQRTTTY